MFSLRRFSPFLILNFKAKVQALALNGVFDRHDRGKSSHSDKNYFVPST